jgi:hypothetical protein
MKTVNISTRSKVLSALIKRAGRENLILRTPDGREFILAELDDFNREVELTRQNKELMKELDRRASQAGIYSLEEVKSELGVN